MSRTTTSLPRAANAPTSEDARTTSHLATRAEKDRATAARAEGVAGGADEQRRDQHHRHRQRRHLEGPEGASLLPPPCQSSRPPSRPPSRSSSCFISTADGASRRAPDVPHSRGPGSARHLDASNMTTLSQAIAEHTHTVSGCSTIDSARSAECDQERAYTTLPAAEKAKKKKRRSRKTDSDDERTKSHKGRKHRTTARTAENERVPNQAVAAPPPPLPPSSTTAPSCDDRQTSTRGPRHGLEEPMHPSGLETVPATAFATAATSSNVGGAPTRTLPATLNLVLCLCPQDSPCSEDWDGNDSVGSHASYPADEVHVPGVCVASTTMGAVVSRLDEYLHGFFSQRTSGEAGHAHSSVLSVADQVRAQAASPRRQHVVVFFFPEDNAPLLHWLRPSVRAAEWTTLGAESVLADLFHTSAPSSSSCPTTAAIDGVEDVVLRWYERPSRLCSPRTSFAPSDTEGSWTQGEASGAEGSVGNHRCHLSRPVLAPPLDLLVTASSAPESAAASPDRVSPLSWVGDAVDAATGLHTRMPLARSFRDVSRRSPNRHPSGATPCRTSSGDDITVEVEEFDDDDYGDTWRDSLSVFLPRVPPLPRANRSPLRGPTTSLWSTNHV